MRFTSLLILISFCSQIKLHSQAESLIDTIQEVYHDNDYAKTDSLLIEAFKLYQNDSKLLVRTYLERARLSQVTKKVEGAINDIDSTIIYGEKLLSEEDDLWGEIYLMKGVLLSNAGKTDGSIFYFRKAIDHLNQHNPESEELESAQANLSRSLFLQGEFGESIDVGEKSLANSLKKYDTLDIPDPVIFKSLSNTYAYVNDYEKAEAYARLYLRHLQKSSPPGHLNIGVAHTDIALVNIYMEKYEDALQEYEKAREIFYDHHLETGSNIYIGYVFQVMSQVYDRMGELELALEYSRKGLELRKTEYNKNNINLFGSYDIIADYLIKLNRYDEAEEIIDKNFQILKANNIPYNYQHQSLNRSLAQIHDQRGEYDKAEELYLKNIRYIESEDRHISLHAFNNKLGLVRVYYNQGKVDKALTMLPEIEMVVDSLEGKYSKNYSDYIFYLAATINKKGDHQESYRIITDHLDQLDLNPGDSNNFNLPQIGGIEDLLHLMLVIMKDSYKSGEAPLPLSEVDKILTTVDLFISQKIVTYRNNLSYQREGTFLRNVYGQTIDLLNEYGENRDTKKVLLLAEKSKSLLLRIVNNHRLIESGIDEENLPASYREIYNRDKLLSDSLLKYKTIVSEAETITASMMTSLSDASDTYMRFKDSLRATGSTYLSDKFSFEIDDIDLASILNEGEDMIEFFKIDSTLYTFYTSGNDKVKISSQVFGPVQEILKDGINQKISQDKALMNKLFELLIPEDFSVKNSPLLIIPDDVLYYLNFELLVDDDGEYLINHHKIRYAYSLSLLDVQKKIRSSGKKPKDIVAYTPGFTRVIKDNYLNSLEDTERDTSYLQLLSQPFMLSLLEGLKIFETDSYQDNEACELNFKNKDLNAAIIHFGTHGEIDGERPIYSRLMMAIDSMNDGSLHAYEIYNQQLNADLAVLAACKSGRGQLNQGEGVLSLAHAFTYAGVPSTVMTLWDVDERATATILNNFYTNLKDGLTKSEALHQAKLTYLSSVPSELQAPYYWAGLVLIGNDAPIISSGFNKLWIVGIVSLVLIILLLIRKKRNN